MGKKVSVNVPEKILEKLAGEALTESKKEIAKLERKITKLLTEKEEKEERWRVALEGYKIIESAYEDLKTLLGKYGDYY